SAYVHGATLFALAPGGAARWSKLTTTSSLPTSVPVVDPNGNVYVGTDTTLYSFAPDGGLRWTYVAASAPGRSPIMGSPAIGADGSILQPITGDPPGGIVAL